MIRVGARRAAHTEHKEHKIRTAARLTQAASLVRAAALAARSVFVCSADLTVLVYRVIGTTNGTACSTLMGWGYYPTPPFHYFCLRLCSS